MTLYKGKIMGIRYRQEFNDEKDLIEWLAELLQVHSPVLVAVMKKLMEQA